MAIPLQTCLILSKGEKGGLVLINISPNAQESRWCSSKYRVPAVPEGVREEHWRKDISILQLQQGAFWETKMLPWALGRKLAVNISTFPWAQVSTDTNLQIDVLQGDREDQTHNNQQQHWRILELEYPCVHSIAIISCYKEGNKFDNGSVRIRLEQWVESGLTPRPYVVGFLSLMK